MGVSVGEYNQEDGTYIGQTSSTDEPLMPEDLDASNPGELGNIMHANQEWSSYLTARLSEFRVYLEAVESEIKDTEAFQLAQSDDTSKVTVKKARTRMTPEYQELITRKNVLKGVCTILESAVQKAQNRHVTISRFITLRQQEFDNRGRTNLGSKPFSKIKEQESTSMTPPQKDFTPRSKRVEKANNS